MVNIDSVVKEILIEMQRSGVESVGSAVMTKAVIEQITEGNGSFSMRSSLAYNRSATERDGCRRVRDEQEQIL